MRQPTLHLRGRDFLAAVDTRPTRLSDLLPWLDFVAPGVVLQDDQSLQATIALTGPDLRAQPPEVQAAAMLQLNNTLRQLDAGWSLHSETQRFRVPPATLPAHWGHWVARAVAADQSRQTNHRPLYESKHFVTIRYALPSQTMAWLEHHLMGRERVERAFRWRSYLLMFQTTVQRLATLLGGVMHEVQVLEDQQTYEFLDSTLNLRWRSLALPDDTHWLAEHLDDDPEDFNGGERPVRHGQYLRTMSLHSFPATSVALMLAKLNDLDIEFRFVERWIPHEQARTEKQLQRRQETHHFHRKSVVRQLIDRVWGDDQGGVRPMADHDVDEVKQAQIVLGSEDGVFGSLTVTVTVWDEEWITSQQKIEAVAGAFQSLGFKTVIESTNATPAYLGSLPGLTLPNPRKPLLTSVNAAHLLQVDAVYCGQTSDPVWGCGPLLIGRTARSNPYRFVPAVEDVRHTFMDGPSGSGKTTFKDTLRVMCQQVEGMQDIGFDVKGASLTTTWCLNGRFDDLGAGDIRLQPYRNIHIPDEMDWSISWTLKWLRDLSMTIDPYINRMVISALRDLANLDVALRTISGFLAMLTKTHERQQVKFHHADEVELKRIDQLRDQLRTALDPFRGGILDGVEPNARLERVHVFELERLLDASSIAKAVLRIVDHRVDQALDGRPTLLWYDEIQAILDLEESIETLDKRLRRARDKNVMLLAATQNLEDLLTHRLGPTFFKNCQNFLFFPNPVALTPQNVKSYEALGLTRPQIVELAGAQPRAQWLHKSALGTRLVEHRLEPVGVAVCGRSGKAWHERVNKVMAEVGPEMFPEAWLREQGVWDETTGVPYAAD